MRKFILSNITIGLAIILMFTCFGCTPYNKTSSTTVSTDTTPHTPEDSSPEPEEIYIPEHQTITILCNNTTRSFIQYLADCFMRRNEDTTVKLINIESSDSAEYTNELTEMLENGTAPDIVLLCNTRLTQNDVTLLKSDYFADINKINDKYRYIDWQDYETNIIDAGILNGERKFLPIFYEVPMLLGVKEHLDQSGVIYGNGASFTEFVNSLASRDGLTFKYPIFAYSMYKHLGLDMIDQWNSTVDFEDPKFRTFIEGYNALFPDIYKGASFTHSANTSNALINNEILFFNSHTSQYSLYITNLSNYYYDIIDEGKTPVLTTIPNLEGSDDVAGSLGWCLSINADTECEEAALRLIKYATSLYYVDELEAFKGIPVNKKYNDAVKARYYRQEAEFPETVDGYDYNDIFRIKVMDKEFLDSYYNILSRVTIHNYNDIEALSYIDLICVDITVNELSTDEAIQKNENMLKQQLYSGHD